MTWTCLGLGWRKSRPASGIRSPNAGQASRTIVRRSFRPVLEALEDRLAPALFDTAIGYATGTNAHGVTARDLNGDGKQDLAVANAGSDTVSVLLGNGTGTFAAAVNYSVGDQPKAVAAADLNGDGKSDLVTANQGPGTVSVLLNQGNGTYLAAVDYAATSGAHEAALADLDGDGDIDIAVTGWGASLVRVLFNQGNGTFAGGTNYTVGSQPHSVVAADFSGDGKPDLAVANRSSNSVAVLRNNGNSTFASAVFYAVGSGPHSIRFGDVNGDGKLDLATANEGADTVSVLVGNGTGGFASAVHYPTGPVPKGVAVGDVNGDGKPDLLTANTAGNYPNGNNPGGDTISVLLNNGNGTFGAPQPFTTGRTPFSIALADFDLDGDLDAATANWHTNNVAVLRNLTNATPPSESAYVSDLPYTVVANGWGPAEKDKSNGEQAAGDGRTITLNGVTYAKGLGVHAASEISVPLNGQYATFLSDIGVDDEVGSSGSVIFQVWADGTKLYESPLLTGSSATVPVSVNVTGRNLLRLVVTTGVDSSNTSDHADWANARLTSASTPTTPAAPSGLTATAVSSSQINLAWTDNSSNETGFQIRRATDSSFTQNLVTTSVGANVTTHQVTGLTAGITYYFQVRAVNGAGNSSYSNTANATPQAASSAVFVSDLPYTAVANGFGPVEKDTSNGEDAAGDGNTLTLNGVTYAKGLGVHASSEVRVPLNGQYSTFLADIGVDDEVGANGSVIFQVLAGDGTVLYQSPLLTGSSATVPVSVNVAGRSQLRLIVTDGGNGINFDHGDWANARLTPASTTTLAAPTNLTATAASSSQINLAWTDNSTNETGFQIQRATDSGFTQNVVSASVGADVTTYQATGLASGVTYYFRVRAVNGSTNSSYSNTDSATTVTTTNQPPQVTQAAQVIGTTSKTATLRVAASDDGGAQNLKYTWSVVGTPPAPVTFSPNGTNAAATTTATFTKAGAYTLRVTITDLQNAQTTSQVTYTVNQVLTTITVSPSSANVFVGATQQFTAAAKDQFGATMSAPITWSIASGIGTISSTGLYQAPSVTGTATVRAASGGISGTASVTVKKRGKDNV